MDVNVIRGQCIEATCVLKSSQEILGTIGQYA